MKTPELPDETLFENALNQPNRAERHAYLDQACAGRPELRRRIEELLKAHEGAGDFMNGPASDLPTLGIDPAPEEVPGSMVGRYKLLQKIGEGGMGVVYMAEQAVPVVRKVALKIIKLGMDTRQVVARFEAERQALALMDHPNIAKVLDAGSTEAGRPYFVMELVRGVPITEYCDKNRLSARDRLELFLPVCHAIQHAHQKGIIHRDIKPSNVMVTLHDGRPVPRVIDFGIAKATNQRLTDKTLFTNYAQLIGTPAYMSPEQAEMSGLDIDTRADVYSLGVLLYELLVGATPFDAGELLAKGCAELQRFISEQEPPRPSTRMSTLQDAKRTVVAANRSTDQAELRRSLEGDLDWIVMKCLEKDRNRRYETANGLASDLTRHLRNEPVMARPPSSVYRFQKAVRRNRVAFAAGAAVVLALGVGLVVATWQYVQKNRAFENARTEAAKSEAVVRFLKEMLQGASPFVTPGRDTTLLREIVDATAKRLDTELKDQPAVEAELRVVIGEIYMAIRQLDKAEAMMRQALAIRRRVFGNRHMEVVRALHGLGTVLHWSSRNAEAEPLMREALAICRELPKDEVDYRYMTRLIWSVLSRVGRADEAEEVLKQDVEQTRRLEGPDSMGVVMALVSLGNHFWAQQKLADAEAAYREALAIHSRLADGETSGNSLFLKEVAADHLARLLEESNRTRAAEIPRSQHLAAVKKLYGDQSSEAAESMLELATVLFLNGKPVEAEQLAAEAQRIRPEKGGLAVVRTAWNARLGRWTEAAARGAEVLEADPDNHERYHELAPLLVQSGDLDGYRKLCAREVDKFRNTTLPPVAERMAKDALILPGSGVDPSIIAAWTDLAVTASREGSGLRWSQNTKGLAEYRQGRYLEATDWAGKALAIHNPHRSVQASAVLAMAQHRLGNKDAAAAALAKALEFRAKLPPVEGGDIGPGWLDWIIAQNLVREAIELMETSNRSTRLSP